MMDWSKYPSFQAIEFDCKHCGKNEMKPEFMEKLQELRNLYGKPMRISSGYRCPKHPIEAAKKTSGAHTTGMAADISVDGKAAHEVLKLAMQLGFTGIGVQQKGTGRFIHVDSVLTPPRPNVWSY